MNNKNKNKSTKQIWSSLSKNNESKEILKNAWKVSNPRKKYSEKLTTYYKKYSVKRTNNNNKKSK